MSIERLEELQKYITVGPWKYDSGNWAVEVDNRESDKHRDDVCSLTNLDINDRRAAGNPADGEYIALMHKFMPKLIKLARAAEQLTKIPESRVDAICKGSTKTLHYNFVKQAREILGNT